MLSGRALNAITTARALQVNYVINYVIQLCDLYYIILYIVAASPDRQNKNGYHLGIRFICRTIAN